MPRPLRNPTVIVGGKVLRRQPKTYTNRLKDSVETEILCLIASNRDAP